MPDSPASFWRLTRLPMLALAVGWVALGCSNPASRNPRPTTRTSPAALVSPGAKNPLTPPGPVPSAQPSSAAALSSLAGVVRLPPQVIGQDGAGLVSDNGLGLLSNNAGNLVSDNGLGVVANNGGNIVGNNAGNYRLAAAPVEVAVKGAVVGLYDAAGEPIKGADGKPLWVRTDEAGRYRFVGVKPTGNWLVRAGIPGGGIAMAIAPTGSAENLDLGLASTLTAGYVLERFVRGQSEPQKVLDRLSASEEAATRRIAEGAIAAAASLPSLRDKAVVLAGVDALRAASPPFDTQMKRVKEILVLAGQDDLGAGRPGTEVQLSRVAALAVGDAGTLYIACPYDRRVWRLDADGRLHTAAGTGTLGGLDRLDGRMGPQSAVLPVSGLAWDSVGKRLALVEELRSGDPADSANTPRPFGCRLSWLDAAGTLIEWARPAAIDAVFPDGTGALTLGPLADGAVLQKFDGAGVAQTLATLGRAFAVTTYMDGQPLGPRSGRDAQGTFWIATPEQSLYRLQAPAYQAVEVDTAAAGDYVSAAVAVTGQVLLRDAGGRVILRAPDGTHTTLLETPPAGLAADSRVCAVAPDGTVYLATGTQVWKIAAGQATLVAGLPAGGAAGVGGLVARPLESPAGLGLDRDGNLVLLEEGGAAPSISRVDAGRALTPLVKPGAGYLGSQASIGGGSHSPGKLRMGVDGRLYLLSRDGLLRQDASGAFVSFYKPLGERVVDFALGPDKKVYVALPSKVVALSADGTAGAPLYAAGPDYGGVPLAMDADAAGTVTFATALDVNGAPRRLYRIGAGDVPAKIHEEPYSGSLLPDGLNDAGGLAVAADGTVYVSHPSRNLVARIVPGGGSEVLAGPGGTWLVGIGVEDSLRQPEDLVVGPMGDLYILDVAHRQLKQIPAARLKQP